MLGPVGLPALYSNIPETGLLASVAPSTVLTGHLGSIAAWSPNQGLLSDCTVSNTLNNVLPLCQRTFISNCIASAIWL